MGSTAVVLESNVLFLFPLGDITGAPKATLGNPTVPGDPKLPLLGKVDEKETGVPERSGNAVEGGGEKAPGEDEGWRDWVNFGGVNDPTGVLSRTGSILGEFLVCDDGRGNTDGDDVRWIGNWTGFLSSVGGGCGGVGGSLEGTRTTMTFSMLSFSSTMLGD